MALWASVASKTSIFSWYSNLSITTKATPLSAVKTILSWSSLSSFSAFFSSLLMLLLGGFPFLVRCQLQPLVPANPGELYHFLGLTGYYKKFISLFADITKPLNKLFKNDTKYQWSPQYQEAFEHLKKHLAKNLYFTTLIQKSSTPTLESSLRQLKVLKIWSP